MKALGAIYIQGGRKSKVVSKRCSFNNCKKLNRHGCFSLCETSYPQLETVFEDTLEFRAAQPNEFPARSRPVPEKETLYLSDIQGD